MRINGIEDLALTAGKAYLTGGASLASDAGAGLLGSGGGGGGSGDAPMVATTTTVSPTFQQSFTPQVSPVIQVSQGGGSQSGAASQKVLGSQQAEGGGSDMPGGSPGPGSSSYDASPGFFDGPQPGNFFDSQDKVFEETFKESEPSIVGILPWLIGGSVVLGAVYMMKKP